MTVGHALGERYSRHAIAEGEIKPVRIDPCDFPWPIRLAEQLRCVQTHRVRMVGIHVLDRAFFDVDDFSGVFKIGHNIGGLEIGCAGEAAIEMPRHDLQSPECEISEAGIEPGLRMAGEKAAPYPRRIRRIWRDVGESAEHCEPRMGERITLSSGREQDESAGIDLDVRRVGGKPRYQDQRRAIYVRCNIDERGEGMSGISV